MIKMLLWQSLNEMFTNYAAAVFFSTFFENFKKNFKYMNIMDKFYLFRNITY